MKCVFISRSAVIFFQEINKSGSAVCVSSIPLVRRGLSSHIYHISFFVETSISKLLQVLFMTILNSNQQDIGYLTIERFGI